MTRRRVLIILTLVAVGVLAAAPTAHALSDLYYNTGPGEAVGPLVDRYPLGAYALDQHFSMVKASLTGGIDASGVGPGIAAFFADLLWQLTAFLVYSVIQLFTLAFSVDLINGTTATGGAGALAPVADAIDNLYANTLGAPWMEAAVVVAGCWAMWRALIQRRYTETASSLGMSLIYLLVALAIITNTTATIGAATRWDNRIADAFLSVSIHGRPSTGPDAHRTASDELFDVLVLRPWVALEFGGTQHCITRGTGSQDHDPISVAVLPLAADPAADARARAQLRRTGHLTTNVKECVDNSVRYPQHFLAFAPGSDDRDAEYDALNDADPAKLPDSDPEKSSYQPAVVDKPATDAMEKGGQNQRLLLAIVVLAGNLGAVLLLGTLAISILLAQMVVLLLAAFSPVALMAAIVPGRGHALFRAWASQLGTYLVRKAVYALVLAILLTVIAALQDATSNMGWLFSFGCQSMLMWMVFLGRHKLTGQIIAAVAGHEPGREAHLRRLLGVGLIAGRFARPARRRTHPGPPTDPQDPAAPDDAPQPPDAPPPIDPSPPAGPSPHQPDPPCAPSSRREQTVATHGRPSPRRDHGGPRPATADTQPLHDDEPPPTHRTVHASAPARAPRPDTDEARSAFLPAAKSGHTAAVEPARRRPQTRPALPDRPPTPEGAGAPDDVEPRRHDQAGEEITPASASWPPPRRRYTKTEVELYTNEQGSRVWRVTRPDGSLVAENIDSFHMEGFRQEEEDRDHPDDGSWPQPPQPTR